MRAAGTAGEGACSRCGSLRKWAVPTSPARLPPASSADSQVGEATSAVPDGTGFPSFQQWSLLSSLISAGTRLLDHSRPPAIDAANPWRAPFRPLSSVLCPLGPLRPLRGNGPGVVGGPTGRNGKDSKDQKDQKDKEDVRD